MWLEAIVSKGDLAELAGKICPLQFNLGDGGRLSISDPRDLELVPGVGLRTTVTAQIHWPVLGVQIPLSIRAATLEVRLEVVRSAAGDALAFRLHLDDADISLVPAFVDRGIVGLVNKELDAEHFELAWAFTKALSHAFAMPKALVSAVALDMRAVSGRVEITSERLAFAVLFQARVESRGIVPSPTVEIP